MAPLKFLCPPLLWPPLKILWPPQYMLWPRGHKNVKKTGGGHKKKTYGGGYAMEWKSQVNFLLKFQLKLCEIYNELS